MASPRGKRSFVDDDDSSKPPPKLMMARLDSENYVPIIPANLPKEDLVKTLRQIANALEPKETFNHALKRLKDHEKKQKMSPQNKTLFDKLIDDAFALQWVYELKKEDFERDADYYDKLSRIKSAEIATGMQRNLVPCNKFGGMTCGGCTSSVKRILESQPQVSFASVNLTTETAIVWPVSEAKVASNWQKEVEEALVKHLTSCGFTSNLRVDRLKWSK
ncbi:copper-transporting ATPase PAA1 [Orobanche hederae]